ncbi:MAG: polymer-forming cytoskeletal protein, partial [Acidobacteria bacterium]|nr:polymer-forming cytoskeletal protein [Acidobacteriota bacterium]
GEAPAVRAVAESFTVAAGTLLVVRLAADLSSETAKAGDRFQGFLDQELASDGRLVAPVGAKVYGIVSAADSAGKMKGTASLSVALTDMQVGGQVLSIKTQPLSVKGGTGKGAKKLIGGAAVGTAIGAIAGGGQGAAIGAAVGAGVGGAAAAAGDVKAAVIPAQTPQAFTLAAPVQVEIMTNVAVR